MNKFKAAFSSMALMAAPISAVAAQDNTPQTEAPDNTEEQELGTLAAPIQFQACSSDEHLVLMSTNTYVYGIKDQADAQATASLVIGVASTVQRQYTETVNAMSRNEVMNPKSKSNKLSEFVKTGDLPKIREAFAAAIALQDANKKVDMAFQVSEVKVSREKSKQCGLQNPAPSIT